MCNNIVYYSCSFTEEIHMEVVVQEPAVQVKRVRNQSVTVHWPSERKLQKRGCTPYVQFENSGQEWRIHFRLPHGYLGERPIVVTVKSQGNHHELFIQNKQDRTQLEVISRQVIQTDQLGLMMY